MPPICNYDVKYSFNQKSDCTNEISDPENPYVPGF